jgi:hypothetical protein
LDKEDEKVVKEVVGGKLEDRVVYTVRFHRIVISEH